MDLHNTDKAFDAFKRTLGPTLKTTWASVYDDIAEGTELDLLQLCLSLENFIGKFYTEKQSTNEQPVVVSNRSS